jgi:hypothetical protein
MAWKPREEVVGHLQVETPVKKGERRRTDDVRRCPELTVRERLRRTQVYSRHGEMGKDDLWGDQLENLNSQTENRT